jgi:fumarylacetoacetase
MYWTPAQMIAHHTANGCSLEPGDLIGSGTASGPAAGSEGCLLERTRNGREPLTLANGATRTFLEDGDEVVIRGRCTAPAAATIGFGECRGRIVGARAIRSPEPRVESL